MRKFLISVNGTAYEVEVEELDAGTSTSAISERISKSAAVISTPEPAQPVAEPAPTGAGEKVLAPMPGNIMKISVSVGDAVKSGETLMILEAMKMENSIVAPCDGKILKLSISEGAAVQTGDELVLIG